MATTPEPVEIYCLKCRAKTGSRDVEQVTMKNGRPALRAVCTVCGTGKYPHRLRRLNLGRLVGLRLHLSRVVRQGARLLLRESAGCGITGPELSAAYRMPSRSKPPSGNAVPLLVSVPEPAAYPSA